MYRQYYSWCVLSNSCMPGLRPPHLEDTQLVHVVLTHDVRAVGQHLVADVLAVVIAHTLGGRCVCFIAKVVCTLVTPVSPAACA
jgi:hypothetical protein